MKDHFGPNHKSDASCVSLGDMNWALHFQSPGCISRALFAGIYTLQGKDNNGVWL